MPYLARIILYPIKSLDGVGVSKAIVLPSGALKHDREFAIFDQQGRFVNGKSNPKIYLLRSSYDTQMETVSLQVQGKEQTQVFHIDRERSKLDAWLSEYFGFAVNLQQNSLIGFPDDTDSPGPTVISTETLKTVAAWFSGVSEDEMRSRFRVNLEIADVEPFWEDRLFARSGEVIHFKIGDVLCYGVNPCQRCSVPTRNSLTGDVYPEFQKIFVAKRQETFPACANISRFNHFYRLSLNTQIPVSEAGKSLQLGDEVKISNVVSIAVN